MAAMPRDLEALRTDYEGDELSVKQVADRHAISQTTLHRLAIAHGWRQRRPRRIDRQDLIARMFRLLDSQLRELENDMTKTASDQAAVLTRLVTTLDKLIEIKDAEARKHPAPRRVSKAMIELRGKIADRIAQFAQP